MQVLLKEEKELLFYLLKERDFVTQETIAFHLDTSKKKIQSIIKSLIDKTKGLCVIEVKKNRGYQLIELKDELKQYVLQDLFYNGTYFNLEYRTVLLAVDLLFEKDYIAMEKLSQKYYVSKTVIFDEIKTLKRWFLRIETLDLEVSNKGIYIHGKESDKRYWLGQYIQTDILKLILDKDKVLDYQNYYQQYSKELKEYFDQQSFMISNESYQFIIRFLAISKLKDELGYQLEANTSTSKLVDEFIKEASVIYDQEEINELNEYHIIENYFKSHICKEISYIDNPNLFIKNVHATILRNQRSRHYVNYYDKSILYKYHYLIHIVQKMFLNLYNLQISRSDILDYAVYLGGIIDKYHLYLNCKVLLIASQNYMIINQIKNNFISFFQGRITTFDTYTSINQYDHHYDLYLTTEPDIMIQDKRFIYIPVIMTSKNIGAFKYSIQLWIERQLNHDLEQLNNKIIYKKCNHYKILDNSTHYYLKSNTLFVIIEDVQELITVYKLNHSFEYEYHIVDCVIEVHYSKDSDMKYFYLTSKLLEKL